MKYKHILSIQDRIKKKNLVKPFVHKISIWFNSIQFYKKKPSILAALCAGTAVFTRAKERKKVDMHSSAEHCCRVFSLDFLNKVKQS